MGGEEGGKRGKSVERISGEHVGDLGSFLVEAENQGGG